MAASWLVWTKRIAALLLFLALFLPLSRCEEQKMPPPDQGAQVGSVPQEPVTYRYSYAWTRFDAANPGSWLAIFAFLWPLPILIAEALVKRRWVHLLLLWLQPFLCLGAAWLIYLRTILETPWTGFYLASFALLAYFCASVYALIAEMLRARKARRQSPAGEAPPPGDAPGAALP